MADDDALPFAVLGEPQGSGDALPTEVLESPTGRRDLGDPASARRVGEFHDGTYFLVEGDRRETVCLVRHEAAVHVVALCTPGFGQFRRPSIMTVLDRRHRRVSAVIVRDGYTSAVLKTRDSDIRVPIGRNVAFFSTQRAAHLEIRGAGRRTMTMAIPKMPSFPRRP
ncbi:MAG TPA: hypothetical protein VHF89_14025 [Solirubrobacteraceae bacterium]|nr:hypothetical protein [Solirubrobacteraceae bacterium]